MRSSSYHIPLLIALSACGSWGLDPISTDPGTAGGDDTASNVEPLDDDDPPVLNALATWRNEDLVTVSGRAPLGDTVTISVSGATTTDEYLAIAADGTFSVDVGLERGTDVEITAANANGTSDAVVTHACERWDAYEIDPSRSDDYGDDCSTNPITVSEAFTDVQEVSIITGNALTEEDEDWYRVVTVDDPTIESNYGYENYYFEVGFSDGGDRYSLEVYREGCGADQQECAGESYSEYSFRAEDLEPDEQGQLPEDSRACGGPEDNDCADFSAVYIVRVRRTDGLLDCSHYQLEISNGF